MAGFETFKTGLVDLGTAIDKFTRQDSPARQSKNPSIAKAFGVETKTTGLMIAMKPDSDEMLANAVRAQEHVNKRRHPFRCLLHSFQ
jgi:hypothetical protein